MQLCYIFNNTKNPKIKSFKQNIQIEVYNMNIIVLKILCLDFRNLNIRLNSQIIKSKISNADINNNLVSIG